MTDFYAHCDDYRIQLGRALTTVDWTSVERLASSLAESGRAGRSVFICGNGGSHANASHLANDFQLVGIRAHALGSNPAALTCSANDAGYDTVFMLQLALLASPGDMLIALSGSGNSGNILRAREHAQRSDMQSFAILGYDGGKAKALAETAIHVKVDDMQVCEDVQLVVGHAIMQWLKAE